MNQQKIDTYIPYENDVLRDAVEDAIKRFGVVSGVGITGNWWNIFGWVPSIPLLINRFNEEAQVKGFKVYFPHESDSSTPQEILGDWVENEDDNFD